MYVLCKGKASLRVTVSPDDFLTATVAVRTEVEKNVRRERKEHGSSAAHRRRGRREALPPNTKLSPPPHLPPAELPATAARGRRHSRDRLAAPPSSKLFLRRSSVAPILPSKPHRHLFLLWRRRTPTPFPNFQCSSAARSRLPLAFSTAASCGFVGSGEVNGEEDQSEVVPIRTLQRRCSLADEPEKGIVDRKNREDREEK
jgi:hypothetical protein